MEPKESIADIVFGSQLGKDQRKRLQKLTDNFKHTFTDTVRNTNIIEPQAGVVFCGTNSFESLYGPV